MKKIQLRDVLDEYEEKTSWTFMFGNSTSVAIMELHKIYDDELAGMDDFDVVPAATVKHISEVASHYDQQWTQAAENALHELNDLVRLEAS